MIKLNPFGSVSCPLPTPSILHLEHKADGREKNLKFKEMGRPDLRVD